MRTLLLVLLLPGVLLPGIGPPGILPLALAPSVGAQAKSYDHPEIRQVFTLLPTGDALVEDVRAFRFRGSFTWAELRLRTTGQYGTYDIEYLSVTDGDTGQPLPMERSRAGPERVLRWSYQARDTTRRFRLRYRIRGAVQRYPDVAQFYWKAIEDDHAPIGRVHITVIPPRPSPARFKVFVHSRAAPGTLEIAPDGSRAVVTQEAIPATSFVEVRVLLDPALFAQAPLRRGETYETLLADERRQARREVLVRRVVVGGLVLSALLMLGLVAAYLWTYLRYGREPRVPYDADYEREPPRDLPPAVVPAILPQRGVDRRLLPHAFAATLLEAARLGYLEIDERQDEGFLGTGLFRDTDLTYRLTPRGQALLDDRPAGPGERRGDTPERGGARAHDGRRSRDRERELEPFEVEVLRVVFQRAGTGQTATDEQIEAWGRRMSGPRSNFLHFVERWGPGLRRWFEQRFFRLDDRTSERARLAILVATVVVTVVAVPVGFGLSAVFALPVGIVVGVLAAVTLSRRTPEAALEVRRWGAFRRFLTDFSMLKEASAQVLPLWERYLVYAAALGVAEEFLRSLTLVARETGQAVGGPRWYHAGGGPGRGGVRADGLASLTRLARSFQNFQSLSRALSSSTRSGGGFSSGGGGGGGGGSSRAG
ncbi:MAG: DUF2207 domain-containing protein [Armatimonadota bacterium]|nr:DUF2207 domain-containing protein [Armatimonadota bacterium]MDR7449014.1 DUF2207 domain-containing protein [Armatimonadota bacterium]MDR7458606.1 DUF2207 domain-containing protein [Armatimonadota bacterium]MDR7479522.1 DUF2207 domain-containing protein [Armatimonadota bacterium]MDR7489078.1 DUF2207 domain-containing protein [Armatimonadota bacterium]